MAEFQDIASKLAQFTITPSREAEAVGRAGAGFTGALAGGLAPLKKQKEIETLTGEFAADPSRLQFAKLTGRQEFIDIADQVKKKRDEIIAFQPGTGKPTRIPIMKKTTITFDQPALDAIKTGIGAPFRIMGVEIAKRRTKPGFVVRKIGDKDWAVHTELNPNTLVTDILGTKSIVEEPTGQFEERPAEGKSLADHRREFASLRKKFNQIVPGKSELLRLMQLIPKEVTGAPGGARLSDKFKLNFKNAEKRIDRLSTAGSTDYQDVDKSLGEIPYTKLSNDFTDFLTDVLQGMTVPAIEVGKWAGLQNATTRALGAIDDRTVQQNLNEYKSAINIDLIDINKMTKNADKIFAAYDLLLRVAPAAANAEEAVAQAVGFQALRGTLKDANITASDLSQGESAFPRYMKDFRKMIKEVMKAKKLKVGKQGLNLFDDLVKSIRKSIPEASLPRGFSFIKSGTTTENIQDVLRKNLLDDSKIAAFAPTTQEELDNPLQTQKRWIDLFVTLNGRRPNIKDIEGVQKAGKERKALGKVFSPKID